MLINGDLDLILPFFKNKLYFVIMDELKSFLIVFDNPSTVYFSGMDVSGKVLLTLHEDLDIKEINFEARGFAHVQWNEDEIQADKTTKNVVYESREDYFTYKHKLFGGQEEKETLTVGHYEFFFRCSLPTHLPASFESNYGHVRYYCKARIERPWKYDFLTKHPFTVSAIVDLNNMPIARNYVDIGNQQNVRCSCFSGPISIRGRIPRMGYVPGEPIPLVAEVNNRSRRTIRSIKATLWQIVTYHAPGKSRTESIKVTENTHGSIKARSSYTWENSPINVPAIPPSNLEGCHLIDVIYQLEFCIESSGKPLDLAIHLPVLIGSIPLRDLWDQIIAPSGFYPTGPKLPVPYPDLPSPTFGASVFGASCIREATDSEEMRGQLNYTPLYPIYKLQEVC